VSNLIGIPLDIVDDRPVDFLKLDVEGAETEVLSDCADLLGRVENLFEGQDSACTCMRRMPQRSHLSLAVRSSAWITNYVYMRSVFRKRGDMTFCLARFNLV